MIIVVPVIIEEPLETIIVFKVSNKADKKTILNITFLYFVSPNV